VTAREDIAEAASTVAEINCSPYYQLATKPGTAWVEWARVDYPNKFGGEAYWTVFVVLPSDVKAAEKWIESHINALVAALNRELVVTTVRPEQILQNDGPILKAMVVEGHREQEE